MTVQRASSLRAALASHQPGRGRRYPRDLKARIIEFARAQRGEGASWERISGELGISYETVRRWCLAAEAKASRAMVPVRVVAEGTDRPVSVASPSGYIIEGLTLQQAVAVLRALG